ncbi:MAG: hypothetical protein H7645_04050 [Candidatus Heimdallarchaeota archaeon]|nr:hypothetical protein [Candidatus Heimdallarchaeota archaeon]MCK4769490.1 hypothetical protein [Candidatus Heimdallarchaeota archaeon]
MTTYTLPNEYKFHMFVAMGMILSGVLAFIIALIFGDTPLLSASAIAIGCGFFIAMGLFFSIVRKTKKKKDTEISIIGRIIYYVAIAFSIYLIIFSGFYIREPTFNSKAMYISQAVAIPVVVISLIIADIYLYRKREEDNPA